MTKTGHQTTDRQIHKESHVRTNVRYGTYAYVPGVGLRLPQKYSCFLSGGDKKFANYLILECLEGYCQPIYTENMSDYCICRTNNRLLLFCFKSVKSPIVRKEILVFWKQPNLMQFIMYTNRHKYTKTLLTCIRHST